MKMEDIFEILTHFLRHEKRILCFTHVTSRSMSKTPAKIIWHFTTPFPKIIRFEAFYSKRVSDMYSKGLPKRKYASILDLSI